MNLIIPNNNIDGFEKKSQLSMAKYKVHQSYKIGKAPQIPKNEAYFFRTPQ